MFTFEPPGVSPVPTPISSLSSLPLCPGCSLGLKPAKAFLSLPLLLAPTQQALSSQSSSTQQGNGLRRMSACVENTLSMLICELVGWHPNEMTFPQDQACKGEEWGEQGRLFIPPPTCPMHQLLQIRINWPDRRRNSEHQGASFKVKVSKDLFCPELALFIRREASRTWLRLTLKTPWIPFTFVKWFPRETETLSSIYYAQLSNFILIEDEILQLNSQLQNYQNSSETGPTSCLNISGRNKNKKGNLIIWLKC